MKLGILKTNIEETLGMEIVSVNSLIVCVNNCISLLHSKEYREFEEVEIDISEIDFPIDIPSPEDKREILYLKIKTPQKIFNATRVPVDKEGLQGRVINDQYRLNSDRGEVIFYELNKRIHIDSPLHNDVYEKAIIGYYKRIPKVPMTLELKDLFEHEVKIREEFEDALTFYGLMFYSNRFKFRPETIEQYNDAFRYFVEDMANQLDREDMFYRRIVTQTTEEM